MEPIVIEMLGGLRIRRGDTVIRRFRSERTAAVLAYLAHRLPRPAMRDTLAALIWPERDIADARHRLSTELWSLGTEVKSLGLDPKDVFTQEKGHAGLSAQFVRTDLQDLEEAARQVRAGAADAALATRLAAVYRGEFLAGYYDDWAVIEQQRLSELFQSTALTLARRLDDAGQIPPAVDLMRRAVEEDPLSEDAAALLMRLYARNGQPEAAQGLYRGLVRRRREELDADVRPEIGGLAREIAEGRIEPVQPAPAPPTPPEQPAGGVPPAERFHVPRDVDAELERCLLDPTQPERLVLIRGPRQVGKTTLLLRGLRRAREAGRRIALTDLRSLSSEQMEATAPFFRALAGELAEQLDLDPVEAAEAVTWDGPGRGIRRYLRQTVLDPSQPPLVWAIDELDLILGRPYAASVLGIFRSWYNEFALNPEGPWSRFTMVLAYSTEAHLFVPDLNQSPFNVGRTLYVDDLSSEQVEELHRRHGSPLPGATELQRLADLVDGHPGLLRRALRELALGTVTLAELEQSGDRSGSIFAGHLQRLWTSISADPTLLSALDQALQGAPLADDAFGRLRRAGILTGPAAESARLRCRLYAAYFRRRLDQR